MTKKRIIIEIDPEKFNLAEALKSLVRGLGFNVKVEDVEEEPCSTGSSKTTTQ